MTDDQLQNFLDMLGNADDDGALNGTDIEYGDCNNDDEEAETSFGIIVNNNVGTNILSHHSYEEEITNGDGNIENNDHNYPVQNYKTWKKQ